MKLRSLLCAVGILTVGMTELRAQYIWDGLGGNTNWSTSSNWASTPPNNGSAAILFANVSPYTSTVDSNWSINSLTVASTAGALTLNNSGGATLTIGSGFYYAGLAAVAVDVPISGAGNFWLNGGTGTVTLNPGPGSNMYTGTTEVYGGATLSDGEAYSYSANSVMYVGGTGGGTLMVNFNEYIAALSDGAANGSVVIASGKTLDMVGGYSSTFSGVISGAGNLQKDNTGTLTLTGANTYTGTTVINGAGGTAVQLGNGGATGSIASSSVSGTGTLGFDRSNSYTYSGVLSGALQVVQSGTGTTQLSGTNTNTGATTINAGTLQAGSTSAFGNSSQGLTINGSGTLDLNGFNNTLDSVVSSTTTGTIALNGSAVLTLNDAASSSTIAGVISGNGSINTSNYSVNVTGNGNTYTGGTTITSGTLIANNSNPTSSATGTGAITIGPAGALLFGQANTNGYVYPGAAITDNGAVQFYRTDVSANVIANNISGTGTVSQNGTGVTELSGTNSYTGTTTVFQGTLEAGSSTAFGNLSPISFTYDGTLALNGFDVTVGSLSGTVSSGGVNLGSHTLTIADSTTSPTFSGTISGSGNLTIGGASTGVILTGSNTYTGSTNVNAGLLLINNPSGYGTGTGPINIAAGATFQIGASFTYGAINPTSAITDNGTLAFSVTNNPTIPNSVSGNGGVTLLASGTITFPNGNTYSGQTQIEDGTLLADNASGSATGAGNIYIAGGATLQIGNADTKGSVSATNITNNGTVVFARTDSTTISSNISGAGGITVQGPGGSVTLDGTNGYSGPTVITSGQLADWGATSLSAASSVQIGSGGSLVINNNETVADLENIGGSGGPVSLSSGTTLTIGTGNAALTPFTGTISGAGGITIAATGSNSQGFGGANTYSGVTTMQSGEIFVSSSTVGAPGSITSGPLGTNTLVFTGNGEMSSINNPVTLANAISLGGYNLDNDDATTNLTLTGLITGSGGSITWCTDNVLALDNSNTFTGGVDMREGTLLLGSNTGAGIGGTITLDSNTTLSADGTNMTLLVANPINITGSSAQIGNVDDNNITISGPISGGGVLTYEGGSTGHLTLSNANTGLTGGFIISSGVVNADNNYALGSPGNTVYLSGNAGLNVMSGITLSNPLSLSGTANVLSGDGTIGATISAGSAVVIAPSASSGNGPGSLTFSSPLSLASGGAIHFDLYDATGAAGTGYSLINASGGLSLTASANTITFNVVTTDAAGNAANALNFNPANSYSWMFATSPTAISGFTASPSQFNIITSGTFLNSTNGGTFSVSESGDNLYLNFTPVPEPSTLALAGIGTLALGVLAIRSRARRA